MILRPAHRYHHSRQRLPAAISDRPADLHLRHRREVNLSIPILIHRDLLRVRRDSVLYLVILFFVLICSTAYQKSTNFVSFKSLSRIGKARLSPILPKTIAALL